jgi:hypothetical protein
MIPCVIMLFLGVCFRQTVCITYVSMLQLWLTDFNKEFASNLLNNFSSNILHVFEVHMKQKRQHEHFYYGYTQITTIQISIGCNGSCNTSLKNTQ